MPKTARQLSREELLSYRPWQALQRFQKDPEVTGRWERAWEVARSAASLLKEQFGATKVVAFGSLACRVWFKPWSDVDLAVWGVPSEKFFRAVGAVMDLGAEAGFKVDLIDPAECSASLFLTIQSEGIQL